MVLCLLGVSFLPVLQEVFMIFIPPERLVKALKESGYSIEKIARMTGASRSHINRVMRGDKGITLSLYMALFAIWETVAKGGSDDRE